MKITTKDFLKLWTGGIAYGLAHVLVLIGSMALCGALFWLPLHFGFDAAMWQRAREGSWMALVAIPLEILFLVGPIPIAIWFFRLCTRVLFRLADVVPD